MVIKNDVIDVASAGVKVYQATRNIKYYLFLILSISLLVSAIMLFFMDFIVWGIVAIVLAIIAFVIARIFKFTSKMLNQGLKILQQYKDNELQTELN